MQTSHDCAVQDAGWRLLSDCPEDGTGTAAIGITVGVLLLGAVGFGIWWLVNRRL